MSLPVPTFAVNEHLSTAATGVVGQFGLLGEQGRLCFSFLPLLSAVHMNGEEGQAAVAQRGQDLPLSTAVRPVCRRP